MSEQLSFIEKQFPVSKVSKESFKERKAVQSQTLTGLGKWWGRKPLILVRAAILGCLLPATDNPKKDMDIFQKLLMMDNDGLWKRKQKSIPVSELYNLALGNKKLSRYIDEWFESQEGKIRLSSSVDKDDVERKIFSSLGYDEKLKYCLRPEEIDNLSEEAWKDINNHCGTSAKDLGEFIAQLSEKRYGHKLIVGDCFAGGGSIPFEAARIGATALASDLNPIAILLTWGSLNTLGVKENAERFKNLQDRIRKSAERKIDEIAVDKNCDGDFATNYLYCTETVCPECGWKVPLSSSWLIGKGSQTVATLVENEGKFFDIKIKMNATASEMKNAANGGTVSNNSLICPHCGKTTPIPVLRHDETLPGGEIVYNIRRWEKGEFCARKSDVFQERLYAIRYEHSEINDAGKTVTSRYYRAPINEDIEKEQKVESIIREKLEGWQERGILPSLEINTGDRADEIKRTRGWAYWHQLFNARQLLYNAILIETILEEAETAEDYAFSTLIVNKMADWNSKLCRWGTGQARESMAQTFYNQVLNPLWQYGTRSFDMAWNAAHIDIPEINKSTVHDATVNPMDARDVSKMADYWITDPPYADAVSYHALSEYFLAWDRMLIGKTFNGWYADSKRVLAVRGDDDFSNTMIDIYSNLARNMSSQGMQIVMFTHSDPAVWAQLAIIMWKAGLKVTAAWNIATETEAVGLKSGNYVKGTVLLVLRKQTGDDIAFLDEINADIRNEVKKQIESMQQLDDKEEPNFSDPDYVLAAYAASLKILTSYSSIEDLDLDYELSQAISNPTKSSVVTIIENAKKIAYDCVIPLEFDNYLWKDLSNAEKFYIKGIESEKRGDYQLGTYQEFARGFSIAGYGQMMASEKANTTRLKTPVEMAGRTISDVPDFEHSIMRTIFEGIYVGVKEDNNPNKALGFIKSELQNYWDKREMICQMLRFLVDIKDISNMQEHWGDSSEMADLLLTLVSHDSV